MKRSDDTTIERALHDGRPLADVLADLGPQAEWAARLRRLANHRNPDIRALVVEASQYVESGQASEMLVRLATDRDPDVAAMAIERLLDSPAASSRRLAEVLKKQARSNDAFLPSQAAFAMARLNVEGGEAAIQELIDAPKFPWHAIDGAVALMLLRGEIQTIVRMIETHARHDWTRALLHAAFVVGTDDFREAIRVLSSTAPDDDCRRLALHALDIHDRRIR